MSRALLVSLSAVVVSLSLMLALHFVGNILFPVTSAQPTLSIGPAAPTSDIASVQLIRLYVPFWAPIAHLAACAIAALVGGFLVARFAPAVPWWPVWAVGGFLAGWELLAIAEIPKSFSFSATAAAVCLAGAWLGAVASHLRVRPSRRT